MKKRLKITEGKFYVDKIEPVQSDGISIETDGLIGVSCETTNEVYSVAITGAKHNSEVRYNSELIADAFNVSNETQLMPSELLEQRIDLLNGLQSLVLSMVAHPDCTKGSEFDDLSSMAQQLINKIKGNE